MENRELDPREMEQVSGGNAVLTGPEDYLRKMQGKYGGEDVDDILLKIIDAPPQKRKRNDREAR